MPHEIRANPLSLSMLTKPIGSLFFPLSKASSIKTFAGSMPPLPFPKSLGGFSIDGLRGGGFPYPRHFRGALALVLRDLRAGHPLVIALDQRAPGARYPFFGHGAQTTLVPIRLAQRSGGHLIPVNMERLGSSDRFRVTFHPNLLPDPAPEDLDLVDVLANYNSLLEGWITERPSDWFWLHDR